MARHPRADDLVENGRPTRQGTVDTSMLVAQGGRVTQWLLRNPPSNTVFTPEDLGYPQRRLAKSVASFMQQEVHPAARAMEEHDFSHNVRLLRRMADLGWLGIEVPQRYAGAGLDTLTAAVVLERAGAAPSFAATFGAHTGIGTLPILYFGTHEQKAAYLPALCKGEKIAAYCLTESSSGSNALAARTTAGLSADGGCWILNGTKQWITNAGFADVFIVYAKVDGYKLSAFIVDRDCPGLSIGREERKLGIRGSSTCSVVLEDCQVPLEHLLYEAGKGHHIAFSVLNIGRLKLAAATVGAAKHLMGLAAEYAQQRRQFGRPIASFPLIQQKLAEMAVRAYAAESATYRTAALVDEALASLGHGADDVSQESARAMQEHVPECSIVKVLGSEVVDYVADEAVQIHGGYGFMEESEVCRAYRDSRINRIFEGTNEINRLLIAGEVVKEALKDWAPVTVVSGSRWDESPALAPPSCNGTMVGEQNNALLAAARDIVLMVTGLGVQKHKLRVDREQEFLAGVADMLIDLYAMESGLLRAEKHPSEGRQDLALVFSHAAMERIEARAREILASLSEGDSLRSLAGRLERLGRRELINSTFLKRRIAQRVLDGGWEGALA